MIIKLRGRQQEWLEAILRDLQSRSRLLAVAPGGVGKTTLFAALVTHLWQERGIRSVVLENRDRLTEQTADRLRKETGLEVDIEKGDQTASPHAQVVVACVQSYSRINRLTGFAPDHFGLVVPDECHLCLSPSWQRIINYHHYGAESLADDWKKPADGTYTPKASVVGFTASPDLGDRRNLGEVFQGPEPSVNYSYLDAIAEGWLVGITEINIPVKIDTRKFRRKQTAEGAAFNVEDQNAALIPIIKELAMQIVEHGAAKKGICFVPSVEVARLMTEALVSMGINATFVSGECIEKNEKTDAFAAAGRGAWLVNCALYNYGVDFPDVDCVAIFGAMISKVKYVQSIYRGTRVLPGVLKDGMDNAQRLAAIAASSKPFLTVLSPFFVSDRINICAVYDMFGAPPPDKRVPAPKDFTKPSEIRDYIASLEKAANKHRNKQARTINPVVYGMSVGVPAGYQPLTSADCLPPSKEELDYLLLKGIDTSAIKNSGQAQLLVSRVRERERLGLASPKQLQQLMLRFGLSEDEATTMKAGKAGLIIAGKIRPNAPVVASNGGGSFTIIHIETGHKYESFGQLERLVGVPRATVANRLKAAEDRKVMFDEGMTFQVTACHHERKGEWGF